MKIHEFAKATNLQDLRVTTTSLSLVNKVTSIVHLDIHRVTHFCNHNQTNASIQVTGREVKKVNNPVLVTFFPHRTPFKGLITMKMI